MGYRVVVMGHGVRVIGHGLKGKGHGTVTLSLLELLIAHEFTIQAFTAFTALFK